MSRVIIQGYSINPAHIAFVGPVKLQEDEDTEEQYHTFDVGFNVVVKTFYFKFESDASNARTYLTENMQ